MEEFDSDVGVDLGGTKVSVGAVLDGEVTRVERREVPSQEAADVVLTDGSGSDWTWNSPLFAVEWAGTSFTAYQDLDTTGITGISQIEAVVTDSTGTASGPSTAAIEPMPNRLAGEGCDPDEILDWCELGLWCDVDTSTCASSEAPTLTELEVRIFTDAFRVVLRGTDPEGDVLDAPRYITTRATCFRNEDSYTPLERQWNFSMREIVCLGTAAEVEAFLAQMTETVDTFVERIGLPLSWEVQYVIYKRLSPLRLLHLMY